MGYGDADYDISLRHAAVRGGAWVGFRLAWSGLADGAGDVDKPRSRYRDWVLDPAFPGDPDKGHAGPWQWSLDLLLAPAVRGIKGRPPGDGRTVADMLADLHAYLDLPALELGDVDGVSYVAKTTDYAEKAITETATRWPAGSYVVHMGLVATAAMPPKVGG